jgi:hypothetical protein
LSAKISYLYPDKISSRLEIPSDSPIHQDDTPTLSVQMELRLPTLLYPKMEALQHMIQARVEDQAQKWLTEKQKVTLDNPTHPRIHVVLQVVPPTKPIPVMARFADDAHDLLQNLGPGLTSVAHFLAVYSCKVCFR